MSSPALKSRWRLLRRTLRHFRRTILFVTFVVLAAVIYFSEIGLPGFLKAPLLANLHARGVDLQFSRLRWRWYRGLVAENVRFGAAKLELGAPELSAAEVEINMDKPSLLRSKFKVESLAIHNGSLIWPLVDSNLPPAELSLTNIDCRLQLLPEDAWELSNFKAGFAGLTLNLGGYITNASALRDWGTFQGKAPAEPELLRRRLRLLADTINQIKFDSPPQFVAMIHGDARQPKSFDGFISLDAPGAKTHWGTLTAGSLRIRLSPPADALGQCVAEVKLAASQFDTEWAGAHQFRLNLKASGDETATGPISAQLEMSSDTVETRWADCGGLNFKANWTISPTNPIPKNLQAELGLDTVSNELAQSQYVLLKASIDTRTDGPVMETNDSFGPFFALQPYLMNWNCKVGKIAARDFESEEVLFAGTWSSPILTITNLHAGLYQGNLDAVGSLNVTNQMAEFSVTSDFDVNQAKLLLSAKTREWFDRHEFEWEKPPTSHARGSVTFPAWTNSHPDWRADVLPGLALKGDFNCGPCSFHGISMSSVQSTFWLSNLLWCLPDIHAVRPEGTADAFFTSDSRSLDFHTKFRSDLALTDVPHLLETNAQKAFNWFKFSQAPSINGDIWGRWHEPDRTGFNARVSVTNFSFRGETASLFTGVLAYTNRFLLITEGRMERANGEYGTADAAGFDFNAMKGHLTNGLGRVDPMFVGHMVGPKVAEILTPYHFAVAPSAEVNGVIPLSEDITVADMHFKISGGPFEWSKFHSRHVDGIANWEGESLTLTNTRMEFYDGTLEGSATFDFSPNDSTDFLFDIYTTNSNLHALMADISTATNQLEGRLAGHLHIAQASTKDNTSWFGDGQASLRDGLIWDMPIFGVISSLLDGISPGFGKTRISEANATFIITNSVIRSDDLDLRSPSIRLLYRGTVGFDMKVDAKVEAEVGRDAPIIGSIISTVLMPFSKLFETRVTGTLQDPKREPVMWLTRFFISPVFHPWRIFNLLTPDETTATPTNQVPTVVSPKSTTPP